MCGRQLSPALRIVDLLLIRIWVWSPCSPFFIPGMCLSLSHNLRLSLDMGCRGDLGPKPAGRNYYCYQTTPYPSHTHHHSSSTALSRDPVFSSCEKWKAGVVIYCSINVFIWQDHEATGRPLCLVMAPVTIVRFLHSKKPKLSESPMVFPAKLSAKWFFLSALLKSHTIEQLNNYFLTYILFFLTASRAVAMFASSSHCTYFRFIMVIIKGILRKCYKPCNIQCVYMAPVFPLVTFFSYAPSTSIIF